MHFSLEDLTKTVSDACYKRALTYYKKHKIKALEVDFQSDEEVEISSCVSGSSWEDYDQEINIEGSSRGLYLNGNCTCPVGYNCKHVVAACIKYQLDYRGDLFATPVEPSNACLDWLEEFAQASKEKSEQEPGKDFLLYILNTHPFNGKVIVNYHITRVLKNGGLAKGRSTTLNNIRNNYQIPDYLQAIDIEINNLIFASNGVFSGDSYIHGSVGYIALDKMLATGRCFWQNVDKPPLQQGEERELESHWQTQKDGSYTLKLNVIPEGRLILTEPALYVDSVNNTIGHFKALAYNTSQLEALLTIPKVPATLIQEFSQRTAQMIPASILPPPKNVEVEDISSIAPIPCLFLHALQVEGETLSLMRLRFKYADHELPLLPEDEVRNIGTGEKLTRVHRALESEDKYVAQLYELGFEGRATLEHEDIYFLNFSENPIESANTWHNFLSSGLPELEKEGWLVEIDPSFDMQFHEAEQWDVEIKEESNDWFDLHFDIEVNNESQPLLPLIAQVLEVYEPDQLPKFLSLNIGEGQFVNLPSAQIKPILDILYELYDHDSLTADGAIKLSRFDASRLEDLDRQTTSNLQWRGGENLRKLGRELKNFEGIKVVTPPQGLAAELRSYQQQGLNWLQFLQEYHFSGILADDMGLGKTVQTLAHLLVEKESGRLNKPCLIVAPTSLMSNWRREAERFAPALKVLILQGAERKQHFEKINDYDIVLSTYPLLARDEEVLLAYEYHVVVLDEAQVVKNPKAKAAKIVRKLKTEHRLCLTGTPMENHLGELWALFDFLMPGFLGDMKHFNAMFKTPIEKHGDENRRQQLVQRISPFMIRRTKTEVVKELPEKTEITLNVSLDKKQAALYESIRLSMEEKVRKTIASKGLARSHIMILDALLKLRQVCCDPRLLPLQHAKDVKHSAKLELLMQILPEMIEEGRRILLFSQFTKMLGFIEDELKKSKISYTKLTGQTKNRDAVIERFKQGEANVFLISLKAGGVGLNLTEADTVIHYDPWWNPAAESQATDRAHRIGQSKEVFVYKLMVENSVEEKIVAMQKKKQALAQGVYQKRKEESALSISAEDMQQLFAAL